MAPIISVLANRKDQPNQQFWTEYRVSAVDGCCPTEPGAIVLLGPDCKIAPCFLPAIPSGIIIEINGVPTPCQDVLNFIPGMGVNITYTPDCGYTFTATGTPTECGNAAYLCTDLLATKVEVDLSHPTHAGQLLISQPGNTSAVWADPLVQGLYAAGSNIASPPAFTPPTTIQPVLVGAASPGGLLENLNLDPSGSLYVDTGLPQTLPSGSLPSGGAAVSTVLNMVAQSLTGSVDGYERLRVSTPVNLFDVNYDFTTPGIIPSDYGLTSVADASSGTTIYTGIITGGAGNLLAGDFVTIGGFVNVNNNGTFLITASTATTLTVNNPSGVSETDPASALSTTQQASIQMDSLTVGSGLIQCLPNEPSILMTVGTDVGARAVWQSREYIFGQTDLAQIFTCWGVIGPNVTGCVQRLGSFDDNTGYFFEQNGVTGTLRVVYRSTINGPDLAVDQANWNIDPLNGTGPSGLTLDPAQAQVWSIDVGAFHIRYGVYLAGVLTYAHAYNFANSRSIFPRGVDPVRLEIVNLAPSTGNYIKHATLAVAIEGGYQDRPSPYAFSVNTSPNFMTIPAGTPAIPLISIRPKLIFGNITNRTFITIRDYDVFTGGQLTYYQLIYNGVLTGENFVSVNNLSSVEYDVSATSITGGIVVDSGFAGVGQTAINFSADKFVFRLPFALNIPGTEQDMYTIAVAGINGKATSAAASFKWQSLH